MTGNRLQLDSQGRLRRFLATERRRRETLPGMADATGAVVHLEDNQHIKLSGPTPLALNTTPS